MSDMPGPCLVERIARFLGGGSIDPDLIEGAADLLALMQMPDPIMVEAGDSQIWHRMVDAALAQRWHISGALGLPEPARLSGADEEGDMQLVNLAEPRSGSWVQISRGAEIAEGLSAPPRNDGTSVKEDNRA